MIVGHKMEVITNNELKMKIETLENEIKMLKENHDRVTETQSTQDSLNLFWNVSY